MISKTTLDVGSGNTPADFVYSGDTLVWKRYYDTGLWVHPLNTVDVTFSNVGVGTTSGDGATINWGDGKINLVTGVPPITHTIDANAGTHAIEIVSPKDDVSVINFGGSGNNSLGGTIDITEYDNLIEFYCDGHGVENFIDTNPTGKTALDKIDLRENALTSFPDTSDYPVLKRLYLQNSTVSLGAIPDNLPDTLIQLLIANSGITGQIPRGINDERRLPPQLAQFSVNSNSNLSGTVLNSDFGSNANGLNLYNCNFSGSIPSLRFGNSNQRLAKFFGQLNSFTSIADPFVVYAPTTPTVDDIGLSDFRIHNNSSIPKADIIRALLAFYIAYVVDNKPGITDGYIKMNGNGNTINNNELIDPSASLNDPTFDISVGEAKTALAGKGFNTILL
jgi:hypothetical protein